MNKKDISKYFSNLGKKGGKNSAKKNKGKHKEWGKLGGRPKKKLDGWLNIYPNF